MALSLSPYLLYNTRWGGYRVVSRLHDPGYLPKANLTALDGGDAIKAATASAAVGGVAGIDRIWPRTSTTSRAPPRRGKYRPP